MPCRSYCETTALRGVAADVGDAAQHLQRGWPPAPRSAGWTAPPSESSRYCGVCMHDGVGHAVGRVEPVGRRDLAGAGEIHDQRVGDVARRSARHTAPACDRYRRRTPARCATAGCAHRRCPAPGGCGPAADWRARSSPSRSEPRTWTSIGDGRAEIQDLADDVGRQEGEGEARETLGQLPAQLAHIVGGRAVILDRA